MTSSSDQERRPRRRRDACPECGALRAPEQRYCLRCGARLGALPAPVAALLGRVIGAAGGLTGTLAAIAARPSEPAKAEEGGGGKAGAKGWPHERSSWMPSPRAASAAVIAMLALGVAIGSATEQIARSAGLSTILLEAPPPAPEEAAPAPTGLEPEAQAGGEGAAPAAAPPALFEEAPLPEAGPVLEEPVPQAPEILEEPPAGMPEIKHVFVVMLGEGGYGETFGETAESRLLSEELPAQGELLPNYYAVTSGDLANQIALLSGQGPTAETAADCPTYADVAPATESPQGQVEGGGCVYPATTKTVLSQLTEKQLPWRAYVAGIEAGAATGEPTACRHPQPGEVDPHHTADSAEDAYLTWRNPFVYFQSVVDDPTCAEADVGLPQLEADLKLKPEKFPALAYVVPADPPAAADEEAAAAEEKLEALIEEIKESLAYKDGGMIAITSSQAPQEGEGADSSGCCIDPAYPNLPPAAASEPPAGPVHETGGGGRVGLLLISPFVEPGTTSETYFNHFSLLATIEELFGLEQIGYAAEPAITGFDESIFNAGS